jgi:hypothetical protein
MATFDPIRALSYGVIGLGFLLAFLAYRLLAKEQARADVRTGSLTATYVFMAFSICLTGIGLYSEINQANHKTPPPPDLRSLTAFIDNPILEAVRKAAEFAEGATTNTSDLRGCLAAARTAGTFGRSAESQLGDLKKQIRVLAQ